jgi:hypothetical protein
MKVDILRAIEDAYIAGLITSDAVGTIVLIGNIIALSTKSLSLLMDLIGVNVRDLYDVFAEVDEEVQSHNASIQAIYLSLHETAQILAAKQIYNAYPELNGFFGWSTPTLEYINIRFKELDISYGDFVWEVKPGYSPDSKYTSSLKKYVEDYSPDKDVSEYKASYGWKIPGGIFSPINAELFRLNGYSARISVVWKGPGKIGYYMQLKCPGEKGYVTIEAKELLPALLPTFNTAAEVNAGTEVVMKYAAVIGALLIPGPLDDLAIGALVAELFKSAGFAPALT